LPNGNHTGIPFVHERDGLSLVPDLLSLPPSEIAERGGWSHHVHYDTNGLGEKIDPRKPKENPLPYKQQA
jgi:hypothetical protein